MTAAVLEGTDLVLLSPAQQAEQALAVVATKEALVALAGKSAGIVAITNKAGYQQAQRARLDLRDMRVEITKRGKEARDGALKFQKAVIAAEAELIKLIEPEEKRLAELQEAVDEADRIAKEEAARLEREAREAVNQRFTDLRALVPAAADLPVGGIDALIEQAEAWEVDSLPEDLQAAGRFERGLAVSGLRAARDRRLQLDADAEQARLDRLELERLRAENAERDRVDSEAREAAERAEHERVKQEGAARLAAEQAEADALAERRRLEEEERRERQRVEDEAREAERVRLAEEGRRLAADKARVAALERDRSIAEATLRSAAEDALEVLTSIWNGDDVGTTAMQLVLAKLEAALDRDGDCDGPAPGGAS